MSKIQELLRQGRYEELWQMGCGFVDLSLEQFVAILGNEAGNLALKVLSTGGIYLGGGIPPRILPKLKGPTFMQSFTNKGRFSDLLSRIPVHVILHSEAALLGAACYGLTL